MVKMATDLKDYLNLPIEDGHRFDTWAWEQRTLEACNINGPNITKVKIKWDRYQKILEVILDAGIFDSPSTCQGFFYSKPSEYLAIAFYESGRPDAQILNEIQKLVTR